MLTMLLFGAASAMTQPLNLVVDRKGEQQRLLVVGESTVPLTARYELEASSGSGNRSVQSGSIRLLPQQRVVLVTLSMDGSPQSWSATLRVTLESGSYEQALKADQ